ncbi:MAG: pilus assembly protein TadG-related protein [Thermoleophilia bacterium]
MWKHRLRNETGQILILFALTLPVLLGLSAIVVDVGNFYFQKRTLRGAVDAAALAAAQDLANRTCTSAIDPCYNALGSSGGTLSTSVGLYTGKNNGTSVTSSLPKCATASSPVPTSSGVTVGCYNWPYLGTDWDRIEVKLTRKAPTAFAKVFGINDVIINGRAVASGRADAGVWGVAPPYTFVALNSSSDNHTLIIQTSGQLVSASGIYVNSSNPDDGFDIKGTVGLITAPRINTVGGWEVYATSTQVRVGNTLCPVPPLEYSYSGPGNASNSAQTPGCPTTGSPVLADPFGDRIPLPILGDAGLGTGPTSATCGGGVGTAISPRACVPPNGTTLQPGTYYGGICIGTAGACTPSNEGLKPCNAGTATVTLAPGTYVMAGGGFWVCGTSIINAPDVMIFNTQASGSSPPTHNTTANGRLARVVVNTKGAVDLGPQNAGMYKGLTVFQNPGLSLKNTGGISDGKCGSSEADEADIAFRALGPDTSTSTTVATVADHATATLQTNMNSSTTPTTVITDDTGFAVGDVIQIDTEWMRVTGVTAVGSGKTATQNLTVVRGEFVVDGHPMTAHTAIIGSSKKENIYNPIYKVTFTVTTVTTPGVWFQKVSGTIYAPSQRALFATEEIRGTSNLAVITGCIRVEGGNVTSDFQSGGLFGLSTALTE